jgi:hypothetical protein
MLKKQLNNQSIGLTARKALLEKKKNSKSYFERLVNSTTLKNLQAFYVKINITIGNVLAVLVNPDIMKELAKNCLEMAN